MKTATNRIEMGGVTASETFSRNIESKELVKSRAKKPRNPLPAISKPLLHWFTWYSRRYVQRHFHSLRVSCADVPSVTSDVPIIVYSNHASWWDPLVGLVLKSEFFPQRKLFAPIDATALNRYKIFGKLGFFGVEKDSARGAIQFLRAAETILGASNVLLAVTPQSRFGDVRERPLHFRPGLGHLAARAQHAMFLPMAVEYVFWEERLPEILVRFGQPVEVRRNVSEPFTPQQWTTLFEEKLSAAQDVLSIEAQRRDSNDFRFILRGGAGQGGFYDWWRAFRAKIRGEQFQKEHGAK